MVAGGRWPPPWRCAALAPPLALAAAPAAGRRPRPARRRPGRSGGARSRRRSPRAISRSRASSAARRSGVSKTPCLGLARPDHVDQRPRRGDHLGHRVAAGGADQVVGVLPLGQEGEAEALARLRAAAGRGRRRGRRRGCRPCRRRSRGSARRPSATGSGAGARSARCRAARRCGRSRPTTMRITST